MEFACSSSSGVVSWNRIRGSAPSTPITIGGLIVHEPEYYSLIFDDATDPDRQIVSLVINGMTAEMVGDLYQCDADGKSSREASLSEKGTAVTTTHNNYVICCECE